MFNLLNTGQNDGMIFRNGWEQSSILLCVGKIFGEASEDSEGMDHK